MRRFQQEEVAAWLEHPITSAYFEELGRYVGNADENVRIHVVSNRNHEATLVAGMAQAFNDVLVLVNYLVEGFEENESEDSSS